MSVSCTKPFLVHSHSDTCDAISIYKYISTQLGVKTQADHRGGEPQPFLSMKRTPSSNKNEI